MSNTDIADWMNDGLFATCRFMSANEPRKIRGDGSEALFHCFDGEPSLLNMPHVLFQHPCINIAWLGDTVCQKMRDRMVKISATSGTCDIATTQRPNMALEVKAGGIALIVLLNLFCLYYSLLKGYSRGIYWQKAYLAGAITQVRSR